MKRNNVILKGDKNNFKKNLDLCSTKKRKGQSNNVVPRSMKNNFKKNLNISENTKDTLPMTGPKPGRKPFGS